MPKNNTVVYVQSGDEVTITVDGTDSGKAVHHVWTGKFDGKDYAAKGSDMHNTRAYTKVDANTLTYKLKKDGKDVGTGKVVISTDGKSRFITSSNARAPVGSVKNVDGRRWTTSVLSRVEKLARTIERTRKIAVAIVAVKRLYVREVIVSRSSRCTILPPG